MRGQTAATYLPTQSATQLQPGTLEQKQILTETDALHMAEQYSPLLKAGEAQMEAATAAITTARTYLNPEMNLLNGSQSIRQASAAAGLLQHYGAAQRIELPFQRRARIKVAQIGRESSGYAQAENRVFLRGATKQSFYTVLRHKQELELAKQNQGIVEDFRRRIEVQVTTGEAARLELTRAEAELATARVSVRSAELHIVSAISALRAIIGAPSGMTLDPQGSLKPVPVLAPISDLLVRVLAEHPAYAQARTEVRRSEAALSAEKTLRVPQPTAMAEYEQQPDLRFYRVGFILPLPVFDRRQGPIREATARVRESSALAEQQRLELTAALEKAYGQFQVANQQVVALESGALRQAEAALSAAQAAYKFGERGIMDVLDAQRVLRGVRLDHVTAQFDRQQALVELEQLRALDLQ